MNSDPRTRLSGVQREMLKHARQQAQKWITDDDMAKQWQLTLESAKSYFVKDGEHLHTFNAHLRHHDTHKWQVVPMVMLDWPPPKGQKEQTLMGLGVKLFEEYPGHGLLFLEHISEGWMATQPDYEASGKEYIGEMDNRIEVLTISLTTIDCRQSYTNQRIVRDEAGKFKEWGDTPLEEIYNPEAEIEFHPLETGGLLPYAIVKGYSLATAAKVMRDRKD